MENVITAAHTMLQ